MNFENVMLTKNKEEKWPLKISHEISMSRPCYEAKSLISIEPIYFEPHKKDISCLANRLCTVFIISSYLASLNWKIVLNKLTHMKSLDLT